MSIGFVATQQNMDQHPVPQNISSYEFRLVGDMTLKQFLQLAGGGLGALIVYRLPLPQLLKWPLIFLSIFVGIMLAFIPVQGRPFSAWLLAFIRAVYSPTEYNWRQELVSPPGFSIPKPNIFPVINRVLILFKSLSAKPKIINSLPQAPEPVSEPAQPEIPPVVSPPPAPRIETATITNLIPTPEYPNILSGLIYDHEEKIVEGAIVEIVNCETSLPVRALRSNKLGQFSIATPLASGNYTVVTEKDGLTFDPVSITVNGTILKPILLKAL